MLRLTLLGVGAMNSPRYAPAGLVAEHGMARVAVDGGPGALPGSPVGAWLVTDERAELIAELRRLAAAYHLIPHAGRYEAGELEVVPHPVVHTSHETFGYLIEAAGRRVAWAPEFFEFPAWAAGVDLMFADAAGWARPIRFAHRAGGHAAAVEVARQAMGHGVHRLVFAHIGRPTIAAIDAGLVPPFGEFGSDGAVYTLTPAPQAHEGGVMYGFLVIALLGLGLLAVVKVFDRYVSIAPEFKALVMAGLGIGGAWLLNVNYLAGLMLVGGRGGWIGITLTGVIVAGAAYFWDAILGFFAGLARKHTDQARTIEQGEHLRRVA